jgi:hypothetical protein
MEPSGSIRARFWSPAAPFAHDFGADPNLADLAVARVAAFHLHRKSISENVLSEQYVNFIGVAQIVCMQCVCFVSCRCVFVMLALRFG